MKSGLWTFLALPVIALSVQGLAGLALWLGAGAAYGTDAWLSEPQGRIVSYGVLVLGGLVAGAVLVAGMFRLFRDFRLLPAAAGLLAYLPGLLVATLCTYTLALFTGIV
jgi:hypothetical protein